MKNLFKLFKQLASIDSPSGNETEIGNFIVNFLKDLDLEPVQDENLMIYCRIGNTPNPALFCAHMDTVEPGRHIKVLENVEFIRSDGTTILGADNKISLATILFTIKELLIRKENLNLELLFTVREETNSGVQDFDTAKLESKVGFVFDGGLGEMGWLAQSAPTIEDFEIEIKGKSAHASVPENGINALQVILNAANSVKLGRPDLFSTLNIGLINGGFSTNTVPEILSLKGDLRSTNLESFSLIKQDFQHALEKSGQDLKAEVYFKWIPYSIGYNMDLNSSNYSAINKIYTDLNISMSPKAVTSGSDAAFLNSIGVQTFCLGDGVMDPHKLSERIRKNDFVTLANIVKNLMIKFKY